MKTIYKYKIDLTNPDLEMPIGAKILTVREQSGQLCLWAEIDTEAKTELVGFKVFGTGHKMTDSDKEFVGTAFFNTGEFAFHVYKMI